MAEQLANSSLHSPNTATTHIAQQDTLSPNGYLAIGIYLTFVGILASLGNIGVIATIIRSRPLRRKPQILLLLNMAVADLGISVSGYPYATVSGYTGRWIFGDAGCQSYAFICFFLSMGSMDTMVAISVYRYIVIVKPKYQKHLTNANTAKVIAGTWIYALFWTFPPLVGWSHYTYEPFGTSCSMNWQGKEMDDITYIIGTTIFCYATHIVVLSFCYYNIMRHSTERLNRANHGLSRRGLKKEIRVSGMCFVMVACFLFVWSPYAFISVTHAFGVWLPMWLLTLPTMFAKSSCLINPVIYMLLNVRFRQLICRLWCQCFIRRISPILQKTYIRKEKPHQNDGTIFTTSYNKEGVWLGANDAQHDCWADLVDTIDRPTRDKPPAMSRSSLERPSKKILRERRASSDHEIRKQKYGNAMDNVHSGKGKRPMKASYYGKSSKKQLPMGSQDTSGTASEKQASNAVDFTDKCGIKSEGKLQSEGRCNPGEHSPGTDENLIKQTTFFNSGNEAPSTSTMRLPSDGVVEPKYLILDPGHFMGDSKKHHSNIGSLSRFSFQKKSKQKYASDLNPDVTTGASHYQSFRHSRHMIGQMLFKHPVSYEDTFLDFSQISMDESDSQETVEMQTFHTDSSL